MAITPIEPVIESARAPSIQAQPGDRRAVVTGFLSAAFVTMVLWNAWLCDDAFITLRTVDNFVNGFGLRWNVDERVQGFTHPLWALLLSGVYFFTRETFYTVYAVSGLLALATAVLLASRVALTSAHAVVALCALSLSRAVVEYSTSGLENALTHALLAVFAAVFFGGAMDRPRFRRLVWVAAALALNRMDTVWLVIAPVVYSGWLAYRANTPLRQLGRDTAIGLSPFLLWLVFSVIYYGFPFPNTAYAKLSTGIATSEIWYQGFLYAVSLLNSDPVSALIVLASVVIAFAPSTPLIQRVWVLGGALYTVYIFRVGGDFMQGRFFAAPVLVAAIGLSRVSVPFKALQMEIAGIGSLILVSLVIPSQPPIPNRGRGISDERGHYFGNTALASATRTSELPDHEWAHQGSAAGAVNQGPVTRNVIGMFGFKAGPALHIVDLYALTDPLLARIPAKRDVQWRIGHFERRVPDGYIDTLRTGEPRIRDQRLNRYYAALREVIAGPLWSPKRWYHIWQLNTGALDYLIDADTYRLPTLVKLRLDQVRRRFQNGAAWNANGVWQMDSSGIEIDLNGIHANPSIELSLDSDDRYAVEFRHGTWVVGTKVIAPSYVRGLYNYYRAVPHAAVTRGYDRIRVFPLAGANFSLGHLRLK
jgi:arabinofuranosyltransferase